MILRTDAFVLRGLDYGETSRIVTLFTRERGKVAVMAKGARHAKSRFGSTLQPLSRVQAVFYHKPNRTLHTLSECSHVRRYPGISADLQKLGLGLRMVELVNALMQDEEAAPRLFALLETAFDRLDAAGDRAANVLPYFQLRMAALLGFAPVVDRDAVETLPDEGGLLALDTGTIRPLHAGGAGLRASRAALRAFAVFARADVDVVLRMRLDPTRRRAVEGLVEAFMRYHVEEAYPTRSESVLSRMQVPPMGPHRDAGEA